MFKNEHMFFFCINQFIKRSVFTLDVVSGVKGRLPTRGAFENVPID